MCYLKNKLLVKVGVGVKFALITYEHLGVRKLCAHLK